MLKASLCNGVKIVVDIDDNSLRRKTTYRHYDSHFNCNAMQVSVEAKILAINRKNLRSKISNLEPFLHLLDASFKE